MFSEVPSNFCSSRFLAGQRCVEEKPRARVIFLDLYLKSHRSEQPTELGRVKRTGREGGEVIFSEALVQRMRVASLELKKRGGDASGGGKVVAACREECSHV